MANPLPDPPEMPDWIDGRRVLAIRQAAWDLLGEQSSVEFNGLRIEVIPLWGSTELLITAGGTPFFHIVWSKETGEMDFGKIFFGSWMDRLLADRLNWSA